MSKNSMLMEVSSLWDIEWSCKVTGEKLSLRGIGWND